MKTTKWMVGVLLVAIVCAPVLLFAQNGARILVISKFHRNPNVTPKPGEWIGMEKEYFQKVTMKNEYIVGANVLVHYFTNDNSEVLFLAGYKSWEDIEKASTRNNELEREAWPDSIKRRDFLQKQNSFYGHKHSDEIVSLWPYQKWMPVDTTQYVYYMRTSGRGYPTDVKPGEFRNSMTEVLENITKKNDYVKRYLVGGHLYGADSRNVIELMAFNSLADIEKGFDREEELAKSHWPDDAKRKAFYDSFDRFFSDWHGDAIYRNVKGLRK